MVMAVQILVSRDSTVQGTVGSPDGDPMISGGVSGFMIFANACHLMH